MTGQIGLAQGSVVRVRKTPAPRPRLRQSWALPPRWLRFLLISVLALGIFFRFVNLDGKLYWFDETYTSLRISGYTEAELIQQVSNGQPISVKELAKYQHINSEKSLSGTFKGLASEEPQVTPLYFVLARFWVRGFGDSVAAVRSLSAVFSLLALPCLYWLCLELFNSPLVGWVAVALIAVSPLQVVYAQEARNYSLWVVMILLSSASLLRAIRLNHWRTWGIYAATVAIGIYSHLLFGLVAIAHGFYTVALEKFRWTRTVKAYLLASLAGILTFAPWVLTIVYNFTSASQKISWQDSINLKNRWLILPLKWTFCMSRTFFDLGIHESSDRLLFLAATPATVLAFILSLYAAYFIWHKSRKGSWLFIFTLVWIPSLPLMMPDLILGGLRSLTRYMMPFYLGNMIAVAYLLATKVNAGSSRQQKAWQLIAISILSSEILSCTLYSQAETWWQKAFNLHQISVARTLSKATHPLVLSELSGTNLGNCLSLTHRLSADVSFLFAVPPTVPQIPEGFSDVFLYAPSKEELRAALEKERHYNLEPIYKEKSNTVWLWKLVEKYNS